VRGSVRDRLLDADGRLLWDSGWRSNLVLWRGLDLVGALLVGGAGTGSDGLRFLAVGTGDPAWGAGTPPAPSATADSLVAEVARRRIDPGAGLSYDTGTHTVAVDVTFGPDEANGELRELGLFGAGASARPGSGWLFNCRRHAPLVKQAGQSLQRSLRLTPPAGLEPGAGELIGRLLARDASLAGITHVAFGDGTRQAGATTLGNERFRRRLHGGAVTYDRPSRTVHAEYRLRYDEGPAIAREVGLFGGTASDKSGSGLLVAYQQIGPIDRSKPAELVEELDVVLASTDPIAVPDVGSKPVADATAALVAANLAPEVVGQRVDDSHPRGTIVAMTPAAGSTAHAGSIVALTISIPTQVVVPELAGMPQAAAASALAAVGLTVDAAASTTREDPAPAGTVLASSPLAGTTVDKGSAVALATATPVTVLVPDLRGQTPVAARLLLDGGGLVLASAPYTTVESAATAGTIVDHTPTGGTRVPIGTTITPRLATPFTVAVPDLVSKDVVDAPQILGDAAAAVLTKLGRSPTPPGLSLGARTAVESNAAAGTITAQVPAKDARLPVYGTVEVSIAVAPTKQVPAVIGLAQPDAAHAITAAGLTVGQISTRMTSTAGPDATVPGTVVDQVPAAGVRWPAGQAVELVVATPILAAVPAVLSEPLDVARESLQGRGFTVGTVSQQPGPGTPGTVQTQQPAAGALAAIGSAVSLTVHSGVPALVGLSLDAAQAQAAAVGLTLVVTEQPSDSPAGTVLTQNPAAGAAAPANLQVTVTVAIARTVGVPDLSGQDLDHATAGLAAVGLQLVVAGADISDKPPGTVISQSPAAGTQVPPGSSVSVHTALSNQVDVPDVRGQLVAAATATLSALGLVLHQASTQVSDQPVGSILTQDPAPGGKLTRGGTVTVVVAAVPQPTTVAAPDLRGMTAAQARAALDAVGLVIATQTQESDATTGTVLSQTPAPGAQVPVGSTVTVTLATARTVIVPDVTEEAAAGAQKILAGAGLKMQIVRRIGTGIIVLSQLPGAGTSVVVGSTVQVTLGPERQPPGDGTSGPGHGPFGGPVHVPQLPHQLPLQPD